MRKVKKENVIEIKKEIRISEDTILEVGDRIRVLSEDKNIWSRTDACEETEIAFENADNKQFTLYFTKVEYNSTKPRSMQVDPEGGYYFTFGDASEPSKIFIKWATRNDLSMRAKFVFEDLEKDEIKKMDLDEILYWLNNSQAILRLQGR